MRETNPIAQDIQVVCCFSHSFPLEGPRSAKYTNVEQLEIISPMPSHCDEFLKKISRSRTLKDVTVFLKGDSYYSPLTTTKVRDDDEPNVHFLNLSPSETVTHFCESLEVDPRRPREVRLERYAFGDLMDCDFERLVKALAKAKCVAAIFLERWHGEQLVALLKALAKTSMKGCLDAALPWRINKAPDPSISSLQYIYLRRDLDIHSPRDMSVFESQALADLLKASHKSLKGLTLIGYGFLPNNMYRINDGLCSCSKTLAHLELSNASILAPSRAQILHPFFQEATCLSTVILSLWDITRTPSPMLAQLLDALRRNDTIKELQLPANHTSRGNSGLRGEAAIEALNNLLPTLSQLQVLDLTRNQGFGCRGLEMISEGLGSCRQLTKLFLTQCGIECKGVKALADILMKTNDAGSALVPLRELSLVLNKVGVQGATSLASFLVHPACVLEILGTTVHGDEAFMALASKLDQIVSLRKLWLPSVEATAAGLEDMAKILPQTSHLKILSISSRLAFATDQAQLASLRDALTKGFQKNKSLESIHLKHAGQDLESALTCYFGMRNKMEHWAPTARAKPGQWPLLLERAQNATHGTSLTFHALVFHHQEIFSFR